MVGRKYCLYEDQTLSHGSEACSIDGCLVCEDGRLVLSSATTVGSEEFQVDPGEAYFMPL